MNNRPLKKLTTAILSIMAFATSLTITQSTQGADTEIYQAAKKGDVTLMMVFDISGSMGEDSYLADYGIRYNRSQGLACATRNEIAPGGYRRQYCIIPTNRIKDNSMYSSDQRYTWALNGAAVTDPVRGCQLVGNEYHCYNRISRLKDALYDLLFGNPAKNITKLSDDKIIGMATLGVHMRNVIPQNAWLANYNSIIQNSTSPLNARSGWFHRDVGAIRVPARRLDAVTNGKTQRQHLLDVMLDTEIFDAYTGTPTARSYAEAVSYMMGTTTMAPHDYLSEGHLFNLNTWAHRVCTSWNTDSPIRRCTNWDFASNHGIDGDFLYVDFARFLDVATLGIPADNNLGRIYFSYPNSIGSGFPFSSLDSKKSDGKTYQPPSSLINQTDPQCSGQGIYMLSDGEPNIRSKEESIMKRALGNYGASFNCNQSNGTENTDDWKCMHDLAETILDETKNPMGLKFKTAVVGFGRNYFEIPKYDRNKTTNENLADVRNAVNQYRINNPGQNIDSQGNFASWGIKGEGGWYPGSSSKDVVDSVNDFIAALTTSIPDVVTGQPAIPVDPLNPLTLMNQGFYGTFIPRVGVNQTFWSGDMNKYNVRNNALYGTNGALFNPSTGLVNPGIIGLWGNGMTSKLPLRNSNRQVFTNDATGTNQALTPVTVSALYGSGSLATNTANRNAWLNLLGYNVSLSASPVDQANLATTPELRQLGALLHSTPIILTQSGTVSRNNSGLDTTTGRTDYALYGSTQGILHVVDSSTGVEKIAFVPKEMMDNQKESFQHADNALGNMKYGVDGKWTAYTQYVPSTSGFSVLDPDISKRSVSGSDDLSGKGVQWVYGGLRMGGRSYYALDLTEIDKPKLKFHINPDGAAGSPLSHMGQSWSKPTIGFVNWKGKKRLVMFVGGGYDEGYENRTYDQTNGKGAGVYMFDAHDGTLLWWGSSHATTSTGTNQDATNHSALKYSVVSDISTFDRNNDGLIDHLMFGDLGGQVFRVDLDNAHAASDSLVTRIVRLYNGHQANGLSPRFYEAPSFSAHSGIGASGQFGIISIASGNRSSPLAEGSESAKDALFVLYDHDILTRNIVKKTATPTVVDAATDNLKVHDRSSVHSQDERQQAFAVINGVNQPGWKYYLSNTAGKLKGYSSPRVVDNFLFLGTYTPDGGTTLQNSCNAGIIGESFQEVFCLPGGVCVEQKNVIGALIGYNQDLDRGSPYRIKIGLGITQAAVGNLDDKTPNKQLNVLPQNIDCTQKANQNHLACLTEVASITNKPVRWYEDNPKTN